jgi:DNA-binding transcriptional ArsR family regulator
MATSDPSQEQANKKVPHRPVEVDKYVDYFLSLMCDTSRRYILELLSVPDENNNAVFLERRSGDIARAIGLSPATTSEHLRQLAEAGLVISRREGNTVYYQLRNHQLVTAFRDLVYALDSSFSSRLPTS